MALASHPSPIFLFIWPTVIHSDIIRHISRVVMLSTSFRFFEAENLKVFVTIKPNIAQLRFAVGGLLIGFAMSNSPIRRKISESGRIMPYRQGIQGKMNQKTKKRFRYNTDTMTKKNPVKSDDTLVQIFKYHVDLFWITFL